LAKPGLFSRRASRKSPPRHQDTKKGLGFPWCLGGGFVLSLGLLAGLALVHFRETPPAPRAVTRLAYLGGQPTRIHLRFLDQLESRPIAGTEGARNLPFFSPDGQWLAFHQDGKWKKVQVIGGATITLADIPNPGGGSWGADGNIILGGGGAGAGLSRVSAAGGKPEVLTRPDPKKGEQTHAWPEILPGGQAVLFTIGLAGASYENASIAVASLKTGEQRVLVEGGACARYVPTGQHQRGTGHLVYWRAGSLFAVPFDLRALQVTGSLVPVVEGVQGVTALGFADYAFSETGTLVYAPGGSEGLARTMAWVDRQAKAEPLPAPPRDYYMVRLSPDGQRIAVAIGSGPETSDIWVCDLARGALPRLTFQGSNTAPVWTPDGKPVTFQNLHEGKYTLSWAPADGSAPPETLAALDSFGSPDAWSPDGKLLLYSTARVPSRSGIAVGQSDLYLLPAPGASAGDRKPRAFLQTPSPEFGGEFSPDGRWIAYVSSESGRAEVYVRPAGMSGSGSPGGKWQVSTDGGIAPRWARNGRELFYRNRERVMAVAIEPGATFRAATPKLLFEQRFLFYSYDVSPDAKRFLFIQTGVEPDGAAAPQVQIVLEWFEDIRRRVRAGG